MKGNSLIKSRRNIVLRVIFLTCCVLMPLCTIANTFKSYKAELLSSNLFSDITQDKTGYIWISTEYGLNKFDGVRFTSYYGDEGKPWNLISNNIRRVSCDAEGTLWIMVAGGLQYYDRATDKFCDISIEGKEGNSTFTTFIQSDDGCMKAVTDHDEVFDLDKGNAKATRIQDFTLPDWYYAKPTSGAQSTKILRCRDGRKLIGTYNDGVLDISDSHRKTILNTHNTIGAIFEDRDGNIWVGEHRGDLICIMPDNNAATYIGSEQAENNHLLSCAIIDGNGVLWTGYDKSGLAPALHSDNDKETLLKGITVSAVLDMPDGTHYLGTGPDGLYKFSDGRVKRIAVPQNHRVKCLKADKRGNIYVAVMGNGVLKLAPDSDILQPLECGEVSNPYVNTLFIDSKNRLWAGHYNGVDCIALTSDKKVELPEDATLQKAATFAICEVEGKIYLGTNRGLFALADGTWQKYTDAEGLPNNMICAIANAGDSKLWLSTYNGLSCLDTKTQQFVNYACGNGLQVKRYARGIGGSYNDSLIFFGDDHGVTLFGRNQLKQDRFTRPVTLSAMFVNNQRVTTESLSNGTKITNLPIDETQEIRLSYTDNSFTLQFSTLDYTDQNNVYYEYCLDKDNQQDSYEQTLPGISSISFSQLSNGKHELYVRACEGGTYGPESHWTIEIIAPFYLSTTAYIIYICVLIGALALLVIVYKRRQARKLDRAKLQFFVDMSHEVRSPLTLIKAPIDKLKASKNLDDSVRKELDVIEQNTQRLLKLTNEILSLDKLEHGRLPLNQTVCNVSKWLPAVVSTFKPMCSQQNIAINIDINEEDLMWSFDVNQIEKVISNLIGNALKFTPDGGQIDISARRESRQTKAEQGDYLTISVSDNGPGIDEHEISRLFERFYQSGANRTEQIGFGIGLNLANSIICQHGGTLSAHNRKDTNGNRCGSVFEFSLPVAAGKQTTEAAKALRQTQTPNTGTHKSVVFVLDDEPDICNYLSEELCYNYKVETFINPEMCWQRMLDKQPDLLISDIKMPGLDGFSLLERIRNNSTTTAVPVILLSTENNLPKHLAGLQHGADAYIDKPFNLLELEATVDNLIEQRRRLRGKYSGRQDAEGTITDIDLEGNDQKLLDKIMDVINRNLSNSDLSVEMIADEANVSRAHLHRKMKELTGTTVALFIRNQRMQQAAKLLENGGVNISQVAYSVGYNTPAIFSFAFKKYYGMTPSEYMQKKQRS